MPHTAFVRLSPKAGAKVQQIFDTTKKIPYFFTFFGVLGVLMPYFSCKRLKNWFEAAGEGPFEYWVYHALKPIYVGRWFR